MTQGLVDVLDANDRRSRVMDGKKLGLEGNEGGQDEGHIQKLSEDPDPRPLSTFGLSLHAAHSGPNWAFRKDKLWAGRHTCVWPSWSGKEQGHTGFPTPESAPGTLPQGLVRGSILMRYLPQENKMGNT